MNAIEIKNVTKRFGRVTALDHVSISFEFGKIYGLLGRNGAGKSTLINLIANRIFADEGLVLIDGLPAEENMGVHEKVFCMSEADLYDKDLRCRDHFLWASRFYDSFDLQNAYAAAEKFGLDLHKKFKALSKGYQSIFKLIIALSLDIPYVIYDEPVLGLDANHRELFYELLLKGYETKEKTIILATHLIEEVSNLIEEAVFIDRGSVLLHERVDDLLETGYCVSGLTAEVDAYCRGKQAIAYEELGNLKLAYILGERAPLPQGSHLQVSTMNLQKLFVKLTEKGGQ